MNALKLIEFSYFILTLMLFVAALVFILYSIMGLVLHLLDIPSYYQLQSWHYIIASFTSVLFAVVTAKLIRMPAWLQHEFNDGK